MHRSTAASLLLVLGCSRTPTESHVRPVATSASPSASTAKAAPNRGPDKALAASSAPVATNSATNSASNGTSDSAEQPFRFPAADRVVAIGDLHGDLASTRQALQLAGAIDDKDRWVGGKLVVVQVGDQLDRGDDEPEILTLLERLANDAGGTGGAVHVLNGNHELMNAAGDMRYVTEDGLRDYASVPAAAGLPADLPAEVRGRVAAFAPGSQLSKKLAQRNTIAIVGDTVFAHAGVLPKHVRYGIGRINDEVRRFLRGEAATMPEVVASEDAPVWTRAFGGPSPNAEACAQLDAVLTQLSVKRMVVGHTVQKAGVTSACDGRVYRVDVGLSDYYGDKPTQVLELTPSGVKVLDLATASAH